MKHQNSDHRKMECYSILKLRFDHKAVATMNNNIKKKKRTFNIFFLHVVEHCSGFKATICHLIQFSFVFHSERCVCVVEIRSFLLERTQKMMVKIGLFIRWNVKVWHFAVNLYHMTFVIKFSFFLVEYSFQTNYTNCKGIWYGKKYRYCHMLLPKKKKRRRKFQIPDWFKIISFWLCRSLLKHPIIYSPAYQV